MLARPVRFNRLFGHKKVYQPVIFLSLLIVRLLVSFLNHFQFFWLNVSEEATLDRVKQNRCESLLVSSPLHQIQLVINMLVVPEYVTARLKKHEIVLMWKTSLSNCQNHTFLSNFGPFFQC